MVWFVLFAVATVLVDQTSKAWALRRTHASRFVQPRMASPSWVLSSGRRAVATVIGLGAMLAVIVVAIPSTLLAAALGVGWGGAVGNTTDRLRRGVVVDFISVGRWPTFNWADAAITVGGLLAVVAVL